MSTTNTTLESLADQIDDLSKITTDVDIMWVLICAILVFLMQLGFTLLEAGSISVKNVQNIIFKNMMDACIGALIWFAFGYAFAFGDGDDGPFIGKKNFFLVQDWGSTQEGNGLYLWFFQWAFAATAVTIISGAVAERTKLSAYFIYVFMVVGFIYPVVVHWVWDTEGWLSAFNPDNDVGASGMIDFAGSGVVHMVGGFAALMGALVVGPRYQRFSDSRDEGVDFKPHNVLSIATGTFLLWAGWYGFNCGSTLLIVGAGSLAAHVATTTTLAAATACITVAIIAYFMEGTWNVGYAMNGILAGLVSITAACPVVEPWAAIIVGLIGGFVYVGASKLVRLVKIDDPLDAFAVHGACGAWGVIAVALFAAERMVREAGYKDPAEIDNWRGKQFGVQLLGMAVIAAWSTGLSLITFMAIKFTVGMRVSPEEEKAGLDMSEHGGKAYTFNGMGTDGLNHIARSKSMGPSAMSQSSALDNKVLLAPASRRGSIEEEKKEGGIVA